MKTNLSFSEWVRQQIRGLGLLILAFIPTLLYLAVWWFIPKTFLGIIFTAVLGGLVWLVVQLVWAVSVAMSAVYEEM